jgi:hypothetical protein
VDREQTLVIDDKQAGAFGPGARETKIKNLRAYPFDSNFNFPHYVGS